MTGASLPWKMTQEQKDIAYPYYKRLISLVLIVGGSALLIEHLFQYNGYDMFDAAGHEYYGMGMIIIGFLLSMKWGQWKKLKLYNLKNIIR